MIDKDALQQLFYTKSTYKEIILSLGMNPHAGGGYRTLNKYILAYHIDISMLKKARSEIPRTGRKYNATNIFADHGYNVDHKILKKFLLTENLIPYKCSECGVIDNYNDKPITLQLDHIDGISTNNSISNLRFLCPNCHSQTSTYGAKNKKKVHKPNRREYWEMKNDILVEKNKELVDLIKNSSIEFDVYGWTGHVAKIINKSPQKTSAWMRKYMPEFYQKECYKKANTIRHNSVGDSL